MAKILYSQNLISQLFFSFTWGGGDGLAGMHAICYRMQLLKLVKACNLFFMHAAFLGFTFNTFNACSLLEKNKQNPAQDTTGNVMDLIVIMGIVLVL